MNNKFNKLWIIPAVFALLLSFAINGSHVSSKSFDGNEIFSGSASGKDELSDLTIKIASLSARRGEENLPEDFQSAADFTQSVMKRYEQMSRLIERDAAEFLRVSLPEEVLMKIPGRYDAYLEKREQLEGDLEIISECGQMEGRTLYYINTEKGRFSLHFAGQPEEELLTGARVSIKGVRVGEAVAVEENGLQSKANNAEAAALPNTFGEQKLLILLVNFQNNQSQPFSINQVNDLVFNPLNGSSVTNYFRETSFEQTWVTGDTFGWFTLNVTNPCDYTEVAASARSAAQNAGVNLTAYQRYMYIFPSSGCTFAGLGVVGGNETWINGVLTRQNLTHELGHNLGLFHARSMVCGTESPVGNNCSSIEYGHIMDNIGGGSGHFHSYHKERLGWLNNGNLPPIITVTQSGNYSIAPYASGMGGLPKALRILKSVDAQGRKTWYYVELRRNYGFDSGISGNYNLMNGVMFNLNQESNAQENYMLDMTPETSTRSDPALTVNRTYTDASAGFSVTPVSVSDSGATINVTFGSSTPAPCVLANPVLTVSPSATQWIGAGGSFTYSVTVANNNSSSCANTSFNVMPTLPAGWTANVGSPVLSLNSGATATTTVQVFAPTSASNGFYTIGFAASNYTAPNYSASASVSCAVYSSLGVSASPGQSSYTKTQTAVVTAYISANGSPMSGASVTFTMTKPDGKRVTASAVSGSNGAAVFSYKLNKRQNPSGTYLVSVNANLNGVAGSGSTSFVVR